MRSTAGDVRSVSASSGARVSKFSFKNRCITAGMASPSLRRLYPSRPPRSRCSSSPLPTASLVAMPASTSRSPSSRRSSPGGRLSLMSFALLQDPRVQVVFVSQDARRRLRLGARAIAADPHAVHRARARAILGDRCREASPGQAIPQTPRRRAIARRERLHDECPRGSDAGIAGPPGRVIAGRLALGPVAGGGRALLAQGAEEGQIGRGPRHLVRRRRAREGLPLRRRAARLADLLAGPSGQARQPDQERRQENDLEDESPDGSPSRQRFPPSACRVSSSASETPIEFLPDSLTFCIALSAHLISPRLVRAWSGYEATPNEAVSVMPGVSSTRKERLSSETRSRSDNSHAPLSSVSGSTTQNSSPP